VQEVTQIVVATPLYEVLVLQVKGRFDEGNYAIRCVEVVEEAAG
jgi:hypothetical protein